METDRSKLCGCKGIRTCLKCEKYFDIPSKNVSLKTEDIPVYFYCPLCNNCYLGHTESDNPHPHHIGDIVHINGIYVEEDFLSEFEEIELFNALEAIPLDLSQSGRRKQNFGPKCNFKKRKIKLGDFKGFPASTKFVQEKLRKVPLLEGYQVIEQCTLEYDPVRGASIDPHIDDCWIWGERIVTVNLLSDSVLTLRPYLGDPSKYNLPLAPPEARIPSRTDIALRIPMPRRSLIILTGEARYGWEHQVYRDDIKERRLCLAYREFTTPYLPGGEHEAEGAETLVQAKLFWYLATGDMFKTIALSYRMGERTVSSIVSQVCKAIWSQMQPLYMPQPDVQRWETIAVEYERKWQFYNCLGAIDGKHIMIRKPSLSGSSFFNYKQFFSIVLMAAVDAQYRFTFIDIGSMGRFSDGNIFRNSSFGKRLYNGTLNLPVPKPLPGQESPTPYVFVADEAFPLMENLMRPYPKSSITDNYPNKVFNYRLTRARQTVECTFGILSARFRVFKHPFECKLEAVDTIVLACCILHNYLRTQKLLCPDENEDVESFEAPILGENQLLPLRKTNTRSSNECFLIREKFKDFYNSAQGSVDWQRTAVERGHF